MKRLPRLKIEISCEVLPDGSLGKVEVSTSAGTRSGYALRNPFESPAYTLGRELIDKSFKRFAIKEPKM